MRTMRYNSSRLITGLIISFFLLALYLLSAGPVLAEGDGTIAGQLVNMTKGGSSTGGQSIELKTLKSDAEVASSTPNTTTTDADGKFEFKGLATSSDYSYYVTVTYQKADYQSDTVSFATGEKSKVLTVKVWDSTTKDPGIKATEAYTLIVPHEGNTFLVTQYFNISNDSDRTYIGSEQVTSDGKTKTASFPLPQGAKNLRYAVGLMDCCVVQDNQGLTDTMAVIPPGKEIAFEYEMPFDSTYSFAQTFTIPVDMFYVAVQGGSVTFTGSGLAQHGAVDMSPTGEPNVPSAPFTLFTASNIVAGQQLKGSFSNIPKPVEQGARGSMGAIVALGVVAVGFAVGYPVWRRRRGLATAPAGENTAVATQTVNGEEALLQEIAGLDAVFERGEIGEKEHQEKRSEIKRLLAGLMRRKGQG